MVMNSMKIISILIVLFYALTIFSEPCNDSLSNVLHRKSPSTLTIDEKNYLNSTEAGCNSFKDSLAAVSIKKNDQQNKTKKTTTGMTILYVVGGIVGIIVAVVAVVWLFTPNDNLKEAGRIYSGN